MKGGGRGDYCCSIPFAQFVPFVIPIGDDRGGKNMTRTVELEVAQATLSELIAGLKPDDEVVIVQNQKAVARIVSPDKPRPARIPGLMKGKLTVLAEDDDHLQHFEEYMP
jgi:antitoxin (DNA-binding transcriptional repressor) of toxin-antitoxin stability system